MKSAFLAELLHLLERQGFEGAPRYLGQDDEGRVLADAYGLAGRQRAGVVEATLERQVRNVRFSTEAVVDVTDQQRAECIARSPCEHAFTAGNREVFEQALG